MTKPWADGPRELIQHAVDHVAMGADFDRRIALISVDNAVELMVKTYLGLPERARGSKGPSRKELDQASESFPNLLNLLEQHAATKITGLNLGDIEWYHRLRNQLYHSGNGITVDLSKVEAYLQLALALFNNLFGYKIDTKTSIVVQTKTGQFLSAWNKFQDTLRELLPPKDGPALYWKTSYLEKIDPKYKDMYIDLSVFRNGVIHGLSEETSEEIDKRIVIINKLLQEIMKKDA